METFIAVAVENVTPPYVQIEGIFELTSNAPDGIELIRTALVKGLDTAEGADVEIHYIGSPRYRIVVTADEYKEAEKILTKVSDTVIKSLTKAGGNAVLKRETK